MDRALYPGTALKPMAIGYLPPKMSDPTLFLRLLDVRPGVYQILEYHSPRLV